MFNNSTRKTILNDANVSITFRMFKKYKNRSCPKKNFIADFFFSTFEILPNFAWKNY